MYWSNFFHFYQPADQDPDILEKVAIQSYRPLLQGIKANSRARITLNVTGALLEDWDRPQFRDLIDLLRELKTAGKIELTGSAKYHALLAMVPEDEAIRQITINEDTLRFYLGDFERKGFFPPEMAYNTQVGKIVSELGYKWILLDEIAFDGGEHAPDGNKKHILKGTKLEVFFRERRLSNLIMSALVRSKESLVEALKDEISSEKVFITGMDGETFGHHRPGLEKALFEFFTVPEINFLTISELSEKLKGSEEAEPVVSTWASSPKDIKEGIQLISWSDPDNQIHTWQWTFLKLALEEYDKLVKLDQAEKFGNTKNDLRRKLDIALASDQFFWASAKPWWSLEEIERGAFRFLDLIRNLPEISVEKVAQASDLYEKIVSTAFAWQRSGRIREIGKEKYAVLRIPFKERTWEKGGSERGVYEAFIDMMKNQEKQAAEKGEYEQAVFWRDAILKIENKSDIYDAIHAVDVLRTKLPNEEVEIMLDKYTAKYREIRGGQPEQRGT